MRSGLQAHTSVTVRTQRYLHSTAASGMAHLGALRMPCPSARPTRIKNHAALPLVWMTSIACAPPQQPVQQCMRAVAASTATHASGYSFPQVATQGMP
ncbi:hypothetical protein Xcaj_08220 [Xanthomonas axonopodis pv. cajani]|uniref:Uncharacterized protein n=1 Tax=Xanthomonas axonopodis pv. cajani TaxID=487827 RepID=A0ABX3MC56_9XANT|nr:hypothetical protein Xcaj_08220 [Xanthomonas axonopodis pv. cajani]